jgi:hypothetical protein
LSDEPSEEEVTEEQYLGALEQAAEVLQEIEDDGDEPEE